ncbi:anthranilate phosphoribosyltransferase [Gracilimonas sediminicola]|uniref:Anthranilate phosphoribosyltransferase n=1 Tax=Gracilimonas sediminicola TaxID=2952158 RepID=A0A9X2L5K0_9BACT|nr:anthranilate phosphoribosyltransferase [Gracilimonas sediminicola]MCP9292776.1 anthranilate phosphoribosyltransferase [Gracilimonas sediminicola]
MDFKSILYKLSFSEDLSQIEAETALNLIMSGEVSEEQIAGFLTAMRLKGETVEELTAFVKVMRSKAVKVDVDITGAIDLVGTGGDQSGTFNISTAASLITAAAGVPLIKHGNRSASSKCGSADVLEHLGAAIELGKEGVEQVFDEVGMAFMFAPMFHPAMKYVMPTRRELGFRTFFNILGPMVNPAEVQRYVIGAFSKEVAEKMVHILANLDTDFAYTFNAHDGLDEVSLTSQSEIFELKDKVVSTSILFDPESIGFKKVEMDDLMGGGKKENAEILTNIMANKATEAQQNIALLNATFAIQASGKVEKLEEAKELAVEALESGKARKMLNDFIDATNDAMGTFKY